MNIMIFFTVNIFTKTHYYDFKLNKLYDEYRNKTIQ